MTGPSSADSGVPNTCGIRASDEVFERALQRCLTCLLCRVSFIGHWKLEIAFFVEVGLELIFSVDGG